MYIFLFPLFCRSRRVNGKRKRIIPHFFLLAEFIEKGFFLHSIRLSQTYWQISIFSRKNNFFSFSSPPTHYIRPPLQSCVSETAKLWIFFPSSIRLTQTRTHCWFSSQPSLSLSLTLRSKAFCRMSFSIWENGFWIKECSHRQAEQQGWGLARGVERCGVDEKYCWYFFNILCAAPCLVLYFFSVLCFFILSLMHKSSEEARNSHK